ncbi:MAG: transcriptional regulator [Adhaeribacter sp.]|nr:transcriptional regulator [Adhaeribacter sp.]
MANTINQRMTVQLEGDFVVFLIGMRINHFWKLHKWIPVAMSMPKMLKELSQKPESGFLGFQMYGGIPPVIAQYWRTFEQLEAYAKDRNGQHYPAWKEFNIKIKSSGDVGIWHETYKVRAGEYECIYNNMPEYGLGKVGVLVPAVGKKEFAAGRIFREK